MHSEREMLTYGNYNVLPFSRVSNIESNNSQNVGLEDYNNISVGFFPHFTNL